MIKEVVIQYIDDHAAELFSMADEIFDNPELGFKEYHAAKLITDWLEDRGYDVTRGVAGFDTAFKAVYTSGKGGTPIGLLCEYDALPMGHACGHHLQGPIMLLAAEAIRHSLNGVDYQLVIYGTPAEEGLQGKVRMIENGAFKDIAVALMTHASPNTTTDIKSLAGSRFSFTFTGVAAHESLAPELSRSAMDGMLLAFTGLEFLRGHVKEDVKFITLINECNGVSGFKGGNALARCQVGIRTYNQQDMPNLEHRVLEVFRGAAVMTGTTVEHARISSSMGKLPSYTLNKIIMKNAKELNMPNQLAYRERTGSTDFAEVTHMLPGAVSRFVLVPIGATSHSQAFLDNGKGRPAHEGIVMGAKLIATTAYDLITEPLLFEEVLEEFHHAKASLAATSAK